MPLTIDEIVEHTRTMSDESVVQLIDRIWMERQHTWNGADDPKFVAELDRRLEELLSGKAPGIPANEVLEEMRKLSRS